jgi:hypothetical protein
MGQKRTFRRQTLAGGTVVDGRQHLSRAIVIAAPFNANGWDMKETSISGDLPAVTDPPTLGCCCLFDTLGSALSSSGEVLNVSYRTNILARYWHYSGTFSYWLLFVVIL